MWKEHVKAHWKGDPPRISVTVSLVAAALTPQFDDRYSFLLQASFYLSSKVTLAIKG
jgi:hypothetical protein